MTRFKLLALVLGLALTAFASLVPPKVSAAGCRCSVGIRKTTSAACSTGSCADSENCLWNYLSGFTNCAEGTCYENLVITQSCFQPGPGSYQVNGYLEYRCTICLNP